jgi:hypothetical protein
MSGRELANGRLAFGYLEIHPEHLTQQREVVS